MIDLLFQMGLSNACFALALAIVAMVVGAKARRPHLAHLLWLFVFVKLLTPPIVTIPVGMFSMRLDNVVATNDNSLTGTQLPIIREFDVDVQPAIAETAQASSLLSNIATMSNRAKPWLASIWLLGSVVVLGWSLVRVYRFSRMLAAASEVAPHQLQTAAAKIARRLKLNTIPTISTTSARLSPMVWWTGGKVRIVIPTALLDQMDAQQSQWILAHELAHVRRRDYMVRWLEWSACVLFWWNPVVWWAQRNLRAMEEICCDALVISSLNPKPQFYANSILTAVESLACPALRPPAMASEINSGGFLERRFKMIVSETPKRPNTRWLQACVLLCAMIVLPLGIASAADYEAVGRRLRAAVAAGELTPQQARAMMGVLKKEAGSKKIDIDAIGRKIRAAVQAGKITKEEGRAKMAAIRKEAGGDKKEIDIDAIGRKIRAAVQAGKITKEEGRAKMAAIRKKAGGDKKRNGGDKARDYLMKVRKELGEAVKAGKISEEDAKKKYKAAEKAVKERMAAGRGERNITIEECKRAEAKMRMMVEDGKAKPEDVERRLIEMRKMMGERGERKREGEARKDIDWEGIKRRIEGAVKSGKMTRKEADAKYEEIKKRSSGRGERDTKRISREDFAEAASKIRKAISEGKITEEQGKARLEGLKKRLAQEAREAWIRENLGNRTGQGARGERARGDRR